MAVLLIAVPASAARVLVEAENYTKSNDIGYEPIRKIGVDGCSGGAAMIGLDCEGEWTRYSLTVAAFGTYAAYLRCQGDLGVQFGFRMVLTGSVSGSTQTMEFSFNGLDDG